MHTYYKADVILLKSVVVTYVCTYLHTNTYICTLVVLQNNTSIITGSYSFGILFLFDGCFKLCPPFLCHHGSSTTDPGELFRVQND